MNHANAKTAIVNDLGIACTHTQQHLHSTRCDALKAWVQASAVLLRCVGLVHVPAGIIFVFKSTPFSDICLGSHGSIRETHLHQCYSTIANHVSLGIRPQCLQYTEAIIRNDMPNRQTYTMGR